MPAITITDLNNAALDVAHIAAIATSTAPTATDRLGNVKQTMAAAGNAIALTAAGSATTARIAAEAARDAAIIGAGVYTTEAAGRAAVADGVAFKVQGTGDVAAYEYRRTNSTTSVLIATYPASSVVVGLADIVEKYPGSVDAHDFIDAEGKKLGFFSSTGEFDFYPSDAAKERTNYINKTVAPQIVAITDAEDRVLFGIDANGDPLVTPEHVDVPGYAFVVLDAEGKIITYVDTSGEGPAGSAPTPTSTTSPDTVLSAQQIDAWPVLAGSTVTLETFSVKQARLVLASTAVGRKPVGGTAPTIAITDAGYTHPKVVYAPGGWNGFSYWMAVTPYNGVVGAVAEYENPHIFCSLDGVIWQEPVGGQNPIDLPPDAPSGDYWSDTHLALGDDGYLYVWYRGNGGSLGGRGIFSKRSRDGATWSARKLVHSTDSLSSVDTANLILSPAFLKTGAVWTSFDAMRTSATGLVIAPQRNQTYTFVFRRNALAPDASYGEYDAASQIINFVNMPWGESKDVWHLDACKFGSMWFLLLNVGTDMESGASDQYLAYSTDGWNFTAFVTPLMMGNTYRSCIVPTGMTDGLISFLVYLAKLDGTINLYNLTVKVI